MQRPLVSIIIATHRPRPEHLRAAIASALAQTWGAIEVIVSDDSPGATASGAAAQLRDPRLRYVHHGRALGAAGNHWWSFRHAHGEYLAILNHDDLFEPEFVQAMAEPLTADPSAALAFGDHWIIDGEGQRLLAATDAASAAWGRSALAPGLHRPFLALVATQTIPMAMGAVFRRSLLPAQLPADAGPAYDLWLTYLLARDGHGAFYVPRRLSAWRAHAGNLSSQAGADWMGGAIDCWLAIAGDPRCASIRRVACRHAARALETLAVREIARGRRLEAARYARRALDLRVSPKALAAAAIARLPPPLSRSIVSTLRSRLAPR